MKIVVSLIAFYPINPFTFFIFNSIFCISVFLYSVILCSPLVR